MCTYACVHVYIYILESLSVYDLFACVQGCYAHVRVGERVCVKYECLREEYYVEDLAYRLMKSPSSVVIDLTWIMGNRIEHPHKLVFPQTVKSSAHEVIHEIIADRR